MNVKRGTLAVVCLATAVLMLDIAVVNTALPHIASDLHASLSGLQWVVDAYTLALASVVLTAAGYLGIASICVLTVQVVRNDSTRASRATCCKEAEHTASRRSGASARLREYNAGFAAHARRSACAFKFVN